MKLYYSPFACSLAAHITCREAGLPVELQRIELSSKRVEGGGDLYALNPMGQVPTLVTDDGRTLLENSAVLTYLADRVPGRLAPSHDDHARYELTRWLSFIGTEIHKNGLYLVFGPNTPESVKDFARAAIGKPLAVLAAHLSTRDVLVGDTFTIADAYLFWALTIAPRGGISLDAFPVLRDYQRRIFARPAVQEAVLFERAQHERPMHFADGIQS